MDNMLWHDQVADPAARDATTSTLRDLGKALRDHDQLTTTLLPVSDGLLDVVELREKSRNIVVVRWNMDVLDRATVAWLDREDDGHRVIVRDLPMREHIDTPVREQMIVELYSK